MKDFWRMACWFVIALVGLSVSICLFSYDDMKIKYFAGLAAAFATMALLVGALHLVVCVMEHKNGGE